MPWASHQSELAEGCREAGEGCREGWNALAALTEPRRTGVTGGPLQVLITNLYATSNACQALGKT